MTRHLSDLALAEAASGAASAGMHAHLSECLYCRARIANSRPDVPLEAASKRLEPGFTFEPVVERSHDQPAPGELWRVAWDDVVEVAVVLGDSGDRWVVHPVVLDPERAADEWTVVIDATDTPLAFPMGVAVVHRLELPSFVFDSCLGAIAEGALTECRRGREAYKRGEHPPASTGPRTWGPLDPRSVEQAQLVDAFIELADARWVPEVSTHGSADLGPVADALGIPNERFYELVNGAPPTIEEMKGAESHGLELSHPGYDPSLITFLDSPVNSSKLRRHRRTVGRTEAEERAAAADQMTTRKQQLAARGGDGSFDWMPLFEEYLGET